jgi:DNA-binding MarR family transcriptional regulator
MAEAEDLALALNEAMRDVSGQGVLYSQAVAAKLGINSTDLECFDHLVLRGPLTAGALAQATGLTSGAITGVVDRLERAGFARRERGLQDRRQVLVHAETGALDRFAPLYAPMAAAAGRALAGYSPEQLAFLLDFLRRTQAEALIAIAELQALP